MIVLCCYACVRSLVVDQLAHLVIRVLVIGLSQLRVSMQGISRRKLQTPVDKDGCSTTRATPIHIGPICLKHNQCLTTAGNSACEMCHATLLLLHCGRFYRRHLDITPYLTNVP
jgi:hypothetical protein